MSRGIWLSALVIITGLACSGSLRADGDSTAQHTLHIARMPWPGAYVGVHGGYAKSDADWSYTNISPYSAPGPDGPITAPGVGFSPDGFNFGGQLGANYQFGQLVIGAEASLAGMNLESTRTNPGQFLPPGVQSVSTDVENLLLVTGRLGWAWDPRWLGYVKGGYARAEVATRGILQPPDGGGFDFATQEHQNGWALGGGVEYKLFDNVSASPSNTCMSIWRTSSMLATSRTSRPSSTSCTTSTSAWTA